MRNPLPRPVEQAIAAGLLLAALWLWLSAERRRAADAAVASARYHAADARAKAWQAFYAAHAGRVDTIADTVQRLVARHTADTLWRHDTVRIAGDTAARIAVPVRSLARMDSTVRSCGALASSVVPLHAACDSLVAAEREKTAAVQAQLAAVRPRWYDRLGIGIGYGALRDGTTVRAGPMVGLSFRVWP